MEQDRKQLIRQFVADSHQLTDIAAHKIKSELVSDREGELLEELDQIEYELGGSYHAQIPAADANPRALLQH